MPASAANGEGGWLGWLCLSRASFALIFTAYSAAIPLLTPEWGMKASEAGLIQSAWHFGYLLSLFTVGFLADRYGVGVGALFGPLVAWRLRLMPEAAQMAGGKR